MFRTAGEQNGRRGTEIERGMVKGDTGMAAQTAGSETLNLYCSHCLRTQTFIAAERGYCCPLCSKQLVVTDPRRELSSGIARSATRVTATG